MRLAVSTVICNVCRGLCAVSVPRTYTDEVWAATPPDDREIDQMPHGCSATFAQSTCPDHPPIPPRNGMYYTGAETRPLLWAVDIVESPVLLGPGDVVRCDENELEHRPHAWTDDEFPDDVMLCVGERVPR